MSNQDDTPTHIHRSRKRRWSKKERMVMSIRRAEASKRKVTLPTPPRINGDRTERGDCDSEIVAQFGSAID